MWKSVGQSRGYLLTRILELKKWARLVIWRLFLDLKNQTLKQRLSPNIVRLMTQKKSFMFDYRYVVGLVDDRDSPYI